MFNTRQETPLYLGPRKKYPFDGVDTLRHPRHPKLLKFNQVYQADPELADRYERLLEQENKEEDCEEEEEEGEEAQS
ncbi:hypothetical protein Trydic_g1563 [Trypoxylus dichotomus]